MNIMRLIGCLVFAPAVFLSSTKNLAIHEQPAPEEEQLFIRITLYPTASLSRYDIHNDVDLYELRPYVELRSGSPAGSIISNARVTVSDRSLEFKNARYETRIPVKKDDLPLDFTIRISVPRHPVVEKSYPIPSWLIINEPRPDVVEAEKDLPVKWSSTRIAGPVNLRSYDFKSGRSHHTLYGIDGGAAVIPGSRVPPSTIIRIFVIQTWIFKQFIEDPAVVRGSEVNIIPWSQVFIRTS